MRRIAPAVIAATLSTGAFAFEKGCITDADCRAVREAGRRHTHATGGPDSGQVCFRLLMKDPHTAVVMTIQYGDMRKEYRHSYPKGSAAHAAGSRNHLPLFCVDARKLNGAISARICTDTRGEGGSATLDEADIRQLLTQRSIPESRPACLLGVEECRRRSARN